MLVAHGFHFLFGHGWLKFHRLHHLAKHSICQNHHRVAIFICQIKGFGSHIGKFLHAGWSKHDEVIISMAATLGSLEIVSLCGLDVSQTGAATLHVDDHAGKLCTGDIGHPFSFEGNSGRG